MALKHHIRHSARKFGFDIVRFPLHNPMARTAQLLNHYAVDRVIDVGANDGGFGSELRDLGFAGRLTSFEPLSEPFAALSRRARADRNWDAHQIALGREAGNVVINVSGNSGLSSSVLPMLEAHSNAAPKSLYTGKQTVRQESLDSFFTADERPSRGFLKIDVQGYEGAVLDGARDLLACGAIVGLQLELSLAPLYADALTYQEALSRAADLGFVLMGLDPVLADAESGRLLQADAVFFVDSAAASSRS